MKQEKLDLQVLVRLATQLGSEVTLAQAIAQLRQQNRQARLSVTFELVDGIATATIINKGGDMRRMVAFELTATDGSASDLSHLLLKAGESRTLSLVNGYGTINLKRNDVVIGTVKTDPKPLLMPTATWLPDGATLQVVIKNLGGKMRAKQSLRLWDEKQSKMYKSAQAQLATSDEISLELSATEVGQVDQMWFYIGSEAARSLDVPPRPTPVPVWIFPMPYWENNVLVLRVINVGCVDAAGVQVEVVSRLTVEGAPTKILTTFERDEEKLIDMRFAIPGETAQLLINGQVEHEFVIPARVIDPLMAEAEDLTTLTGEEAWEVAPHWAADGRLTVVITMLKGGPTKAFVHLEAVNCADNESQMCEFKVGELPYIFWLENQIPQDYVHVWINGKCVTTVEVPDKPEVAETAAR